MPRREVHFGGVEDDRRDSTAPSSPLGLDPVATDSAARRHAHFTLALVQCCNGALQGKITGELAKAFGRWGDGGGSL